jgi:AbrB family looped-hinge helix DNA binding protein
MTIIRMRSRGQLTLPDAVRRAAHVEEGDVLVAEVEEDRIVLRPKRLIDASQAWFWTESWQQGEREASAEIAAGETTVHDSDEEFLRSLD